MAPLEFTNVLYVPALCINLFSVLYLTMCHHFTVSIDWVWHHALHQRQQISIAFQVKIGACTAAYLWETPFLLKSCFPFICHHPPHEVFHGTKPDLSMIHVWGCTAYVLIQRDKCPLGSLGIHMERCVFIGYQEGGHLWESWLQWVLLHVPEALLFSTSLPLLELPPGPSSLHLRQCSGHFTCSTDASPWGVNPSVSVLPSLPPPPQPPSISPQHSNSSSHTHFHLSFTSSSHSFICTTSWLINVLGNSNVPDRDQWFPEQWTVPDCYKQSESLLLLWSLFRWLWWSYRPHPGWCCICTRPTSYLWPAAVLLWCRTVSGLWGRDGGPLSQ